MDSRDVLWEVNAGVVRGWLLNAFLRTTPGQEWFTRRRLASNPMTDPKVFVTFYDEDGNLLPVETVRLEQERGIIL